MVGARLVATVTSKAMFPFCAIGPSQVNLVDTAAILNLLDLRSIMGCPGGTRSVFTRAFSGKKRSSLCISREKGDHYYIHFSHYNLFLEKSLKKIGPKSARKY